MLQRIGNGKVLIVESQVRWVDGHVDFGDGFRAAVDTSISVASADTRTELQDWPRIADRVRGMSDRHPLTVAAPGSSSAA